MKIRATSCRDFHSVHPATSLRLAPSVRNEDAPASRRHFHLFIGDPAGIRTQDPYIKSVLLYQLSYGIELSSGETCPPVLQYLLLHRF